MLSMFEDKQKEYAVLGSMKEHQQYLMDMIDDKNALIAKQKQDYIDL
jgi:hypothetical protein